MIRLTDSLKLAYTKIRTRKIRLLISVITASLLFAGLTAGSLIFSGITSSIESFSNEGFAKRYIVAGSYMDTSVFTARGGDDPATIARAEVLEKADQEKRKAAAKRLGIEYQQSESDKAVFTNPDGTKFVNSMTRIGQQVIAEKAATNPHKIDLNAFKKQIGDGAVKYYESRSMAMQGSQINPSRLIPLADGKERYDIGDGSVQNGMPGAAKGIVGIVNGWTLMSNELATPFVLPGQKFEVGADGSIPIIVSYSAAQEILKLSELDSKATPQQRKERVATVRRDIAGKAFDVCYRNSASNLSLQNAIQQQADLKQNGSKKDYQKPELLYGLPTTPCTDPVVQRDVRSSETKQYDSKMLQFDKEFGAQDPKSEILHFRIVGVTPDREFPMGMPSIEDLIGLVAMSSLGASWISPISVYDTNPAVQDMFQIPSTNMGMESQQRFMAEYTSSSRAREVLDQKNCTILYPGMSLAPGQVACNNETRQFTLQPFGSASLTLEDITKGFRQTQLIAAGIIAALASLILMGMIGRIISDSRKETAVFRAVGASRLAVSQIYVTYTMYLVILIVVVAFAIGLGVALAVDGKYSMNTGITMALLFNVKNLDKTFHYYSFDWYDVGLITAVVATAALLGALIPILRNMRRNPIRDMRDE